MRSVFLRRRLGIAVILVLILNITISSAALADTGTVTVTATNNAKITISLADTSADFGANLDPSGTASTSTDTVASFLGSTGNQGSYYLWRANAGSGLVISVKSNMVWNGTVSASENSGGSASPSLTIASGALRWGTSVPTSYDTAAALTAFSTVTTTAWLSNVPKGVSTSTNYYAMRLDWNDDPGTFSSNVLYTATQ